MTGLKRRDVIGIKVTEVMPSFDRGDDWFKLTGKTALTGEATRFESYFEPLNRWYDINAYSDREGYVAVFFCDITTKKIEKMTLEKLAVLVEENLQNTTGEINFQGLADGLLELSGARFTIINTYEQDNSKTVTRTISGLADKSQKVCDILGFEVIGKAWDILPDRLNAFRKNRLLHFADLCEASTGAIPKQLAQVLEVTFATGKVYVAEVAHKGKIIGDLIIITPWGKDLQYPHIIELFAAQLGAMLVRNQAEIALKKSKEEYRLLVESLNEVVYSLDQQGRITYASPNITELAGYTIEEVVGKPYLDFVHPEDRPERMERFKKILADVNEPSEYRLLTTEGRSIWVRTHARLLCKNGEFVAIQGVLTDITDRIKMENELQENKALQQLLISMATELINITPGEVDAAIKRMLIKIGMFCQVDRVFIFQHDFRQKITTNTHEWCAEGINQEIDNLQATPFEFFSDILEAHRSGEFVYIPSVQNMRQEHPLKKILEAQNIRSTLLLPLLKKNINSGFVGFDAVIRERVFTEEEISLLQVFAELIVNIEVRRQRDGC